MIEGQGKNYQVFNDGLEISFDDENTEHNKIMATRKFEIDNTLSTYSRGGSVKSSRSDSLFATDLF